jgi:lipoate-protein ligase A
VAWRFLNTGDEQGSFNMATDEALLRECRAGRSTPVLRVYGWKPWTISVGRMENVDVRLDAASCERDGIPVIRRPTGGRAVYHAQEVTYSFAARFADLPVGPTVGDTYRFVAEALVQGLISLGVPAEVWRPGPRGERVARVAGDDRSPRRGPCFASVSQYEICVQGRKLVGSAQRRWPDGILQHGSILLGPAHCGIERYLRTGPSRETGSLASLTTNVADVLGREVQPGELVPHLLDAARRVWGMEILEEGLRPEEREHVEQLRAGKYGTEGWNRSGRMQTAPLGDER